MKQTKVDFVLKMDKQENYKTPSVRDVL